MNKEGWQHYISWFRFARGRPLHSLLLYPQPLPALTHRVLSPAPPPTRTHRHPPFVCCATTAPPLVRVPPTIVHFQRPPSLPTQPSPVCPLVVQLPSVTHPSPNSAFRPPHACAIPVIHGNSPSVVQVPSPSFRCRPRRSHAVPVVHGTVPVVPWCRPHRSRAIPTHSPPSLLFTRRPPSFSQ